ncbi:MAG TPA: hypothetical protein DCZ00_02265 [Lactococcus sp.]|uniref:DUF5361 domain-containing protein n=1 Tax=Lactococcus TaxID=1357 RepID=UPI000E807F64|nr:MULTISPECIES: DUF5361 domain-containing protein [Lactococcus]HBC90251.1 hypothetical protein [Lactococcus sp.]
MIELDEEALMCDLAETYHIHDYRQLPARRIAVFSLGLRDDSRIKMRLSGQAVSLDSMLQAAVHDKLSLLVWMKTKDGAKNVNRPKMVTESLMPQSKKENKNVSFNSGEDFEKTRQRLLKGGQ